MSKYGKLKKEKQTIDCGLRKQVSDLHNIRSDSERLAYLSNHAEEVFDDIGAEFEYLTQLNGTDVAFLFLATALQCVRQYLITNFPERVDDQTAAENSGKAEEHSNRGEIYYHPTLEEVITNPVPFDANIGSNGALANGGKLGHRATAIGHDPVIGLVVGTSNIATATLTTWKWDTYHIKSQMLIAKTGRNMGVRDTFVAEADTSQMLYFARQRLLNEGLEGKVLMATSLAKEIKHLQSDIGSKDSLPFPIVSRISPQLASEMAKYGIDFGNTVQVGKQGLWAVSINIIIAMLHRLLFALTDDQDHKLYEVRTRKILSYSNTIATSSNLLAVGIAEGVAFYTGNADLAGKGLRYLDIGGLVITTHRLLSDKKFISDVKREFLTNRWYEKVMNNTEEERGISNDGI